MEFWEGCMTVTTVVRFDGRIIILCLPSHVFQWKMVSRRGEQSKRSKVCPSSIQTPKCSSNKTNIRL